MAEKSKVKLPDIIVSTVSDDTDGLVQERRNSIANALELRLSCTNRLIPLQHQVVHALHVRWWPG